MSDMPPKRFFILQICIDIFKKLQSIFGTRALLAFAILLSGIYKFRSKKHDNIPPAPLYKPIIGHALLIDRHVFKLKDFMQKEVEIFTQLGAKCGIYSVSLPSKTQVYIASPPLLDLVFRERFTDAIKHPDVYSALFVLLGDGIFTSNGTRWKKHRNIASHMFTVRSLRDYMFNVFNETTDVLLTKFDAVMQANDNNSIDFYDMWNRLTFEAFTKIAFGVDVGVIASAPKMAEFGYRFDRAFACCTFRSFSAIPWKIKRKFRFIPGLVSYENEIDEHSEWLERYVYDIIHQRKEHYKNELANKTRSEKRKMKQTEKYDLLSMFIEDNKDITDKELRDITFSFIIAGKDTTAQMLSWFMYHIFENNLVEIEKKIREEMKEVFGAEAYDNNSICIKYEDLNKCNYIEGCLKETLRLYPSVPHLVRSAVRDIKTPNGYTIRKGDEVWICAYAMARLPWIWDDPLEFKPERFADSKKQPDPSQFPAFNIAPRICLGKHVAIMEGKIAVIKLFAKYKNIRTVEDQKIGWIPSPTNQMSPGYRTYLS